MVARRGQILRAVVAAVTLAATGCTGLGGTEPEREVAPSAIPTPTVTQLRSGPVATEAPAGSAPVGTDGAPGAVSAQPLTAVEVVERVRPAVVTVVNERLAGGLGADQALEAGRGTGFVVDDRGHIVTNEHVVSGGDRFEVILADGETRPATLVGADPLSDLAVVRVEGPLPAAVPFGDSDALQPGQPVLAIGSPLGAFTNTVTDGIVSALGRDLPGATSQGEPGYSNLIQHNAAINPGNSGGPLFDLAGQVIGVNTLGIPETQEGPVQGLFFAIPANTVREIATQLIAEGRVAYPSLGASVIPITEELASQYELPVDHGVYVRRLAPGGPAARSGIQEGDFILALNGRRIDEANTYTEVLFSYRPGETVEAKVRRGDEELTIPVTLRERPPR